MSLPPDLPPLPDSDTLPCGVLRLDAGGRVEALNQVLAAWVGQPVAALLGEPADVLLTVPSRVMFQSRVLPVLRLHGHADEVTLALRSASGAPVHVLMYARRRPGDAGVACDAVLVPVQQRRRLEEETLRVRRAADLAPYMIFQLWVPASLDEARFPYASEAIRALYGVSAEAAAASAEAVFQRVHPEDREALRSTLRDAMAVMGPWQVRFRLQGASTAAGGPVWHELNASPRGLADGQTLWHGHVGDISARVALEEAMAQQHAAEGAARARSAFLARVSHELRTPLNGILGFAQLLSHDAREGLSAEQRRRVQTIESAGRTLLELVDEVLDLNAIDSGQFKVRLAAVDAAAVAGQALAMAGPAAAHAGLQLQPAPGEAWPAGLPPVLADARRLLQVLGSLLSNAVKYTPPGGRVVLSLQPAEGGVAFTVRDTGLGLSAEQQAQLFEPFNRLGAERTATPGSGLGLVITRGLVGLMGGRLEVASEAGAGSAFTVWLPGAPGVTEAAAAAGTVFASGEDSQPAPAVAQQPLPCPAAAAAVATTAAPRRLLYVEDNEVNALLMQAIVALRPALQLQVVPDMAQALACARQAPPELVLLDLHLPDGDGYTLLQALRALPGLQRVPAVVVSASAHAEERQRALAAGFDAYWTKPLDLAQTLAGFDQLLGEAAGRA